jgi:hypothetical protein
MFNEQDSVLKENQQKKSIAVLAPGFGLAAVKKTTGDLRQQ